MAKSFSAVNIRQVDLDHRQLGRLERVEDGDRGVRVGAGIEDDAIGILACLLDPVDQLALVVGLAEIDRQAQLRRLLQARLFDIGQGLAPVGRGLADTEKVQVRPIEDQDCRSGHAEAPAVRSWRLIARGAWGARRVQ